MKVVVFTAYTHWPLHYETDLEIIQRHLDEGDEVTHLHCDSALLACDANPHHEPNRCRECMGIRRRGSELLSPGVKTVPFLNLTDQDRREMATLQKRFDNVEQLRAYRVGNFDIGRAVLSSMVSLTRDPVPDLTNPRNLIARFIIAAFSAYRSTENYLREHKTDRMYVFNGRFAHARGVLRACQSLGVPCFLHERGQDLQHYGIFENTLPHDLAYTEGRIRKKWLEAGGDPGRTATAEKFYLDRSKGVIQSWYSFTDSQRAGQLPLGWDSSKCNIAIFNSSEDEFVAIGDEWINPLYSKEQEGLERIIESLSKSADNLHVYLRIHPNLKNVDNAQTRELATLKADFLTVLPPEDSVCSYTLMKQADKVLTFGSTAGIEAVFWGTPSILAGKSFYQDLGGTYNPSNHEELVELLRTELVPKDKTPALMYGYYLNTYGITFKYYRALNMQEGLFKGQKVVPKRTAWQGIDQAVNRILVLRLMKRAFLTLRDRRRVTGALQLE